MRTISTCRWVTSATLAMLAVAGTGFGDGTAQRFEQGRMGLEIRYESIPGVPVKPARTGRLPDRGV